ncbi:MAG: GTP cyclohydrolase I [Rickettsiales bacterium]|jgi:GTP cyclohydrolase I|nr:GTP cyclohydrolase I [Rickettsiales bacterium]
MNLDKIENGFRLLIEGTGDNPARTGLVETPKRAAQGLTALLEGYDQDDGSFYKTFECNNSDLVLVRDIEFASVCEHHFMPFYGLVTLGYIPSGRILGLSKFCRIVDCFSKRLQIQENLVRDIGNSIVEHLRPSDLFVLARAKHLCMTCRGVNKRKVNVTTLFTYGKYANSSEIDLLKLAGDGANSF